MLRKTRKQKKLKYNLMKKLKKDIKKLFQNQIKKKHFRINFLK